MSFLSFLSSLLVSLLQRYRNTLAKYCSLHLVSQHTRVKWTLIIRVLNIPTYPTASSWLQNNQTELITTHTYTLIPTFSKDIPYYLRYFHLPTNLVGSSLLQRYNINYFDFYFPMSVQHNFTQLS